MEVIDQIEEDIVFGLYPPGSRIVEDVLQKRFGLSRYLLRSILGELESRGLVTRVPNRGALIKEPTPDEIDDLYEIREILELQAAARTPLPIPKEGLKRLEDLVETHAEAASEGDLRRVFRLNVALHRHQYSFCQNEMLRGVVEEYSRRVHSIRAVKYSEPGHLDVVVAQHREILEAMRQCDTERYVAAVRVHLPDSSIAYRRAWELKHGKSEKVV
ncbi:GntR family transcriptional regulator [Rhodobacteraceae bacterium R_SAG2]|nr:GntR family transcriptional regulator [Rhodobacteraceae bacterium R_SAG2]